MQEVNRGTITLVLGGVRSGKSRYALECAKTSGRVVFVATAQAYDDEMREKIRRHQLERPANWLTIEEPAELGRIVREHAADSDRLIIDCLTFFAANLLDVAQNDPSKSESLLEEFLLALRATSASIVLVSNEVGSGVVPEYPSGRRFRDLLGEINQKVAAIADRAILMIAGLPIALKGNLEVQL